VEDLSEPTQNAIIIFFVLTLFAVTGAVIWVLARLLRWRWQHLSFPLSLALSHTILLVICVALAPTGIFFAEPPFDDVYFGYFLYPGIHIYLLSGPVVEVLNPFLYGLDWWGAVLAGLVVPGLIGIIVGGIQWYLIGKLIECLRKNRYRCVSQAV
jgi:hypothetical protein